MTADKLRDDSRVKAVDSLGEAKSRYILTLKKGFIDSESGMHVIMGRTIAEVGRRMKYVEQCACWQCLAKEE